MTTFDYTNRDYASIRADLLNRASVVLPEWTSRDSSDFGMLFVDLVSYMGDILHYYVDQAARESFLETATRRSSLLAIASLLDYIPHGRTSARTTITLNAAASLATDAAPILIPVNTKFTANPLLETADSVIFTSNQAFAFNATGATVAGYTTFAKATPATLALTEGELFTETFTSSGQLSQRYTIAKTGVVTNSIVITVAEGVAGASVSYSQVTRLIEHTNSDKVYVTSIEADDTVVVQFGNGIHGKIPAINSVVTIIYRKSRGSAGNVEANSVTSFFALSNAFGPTYDGIVITPNTSRAIGGSNSESIVSLKANIPTTFRSQDRAVSLQDYEDLVLRVPGITKTKTEIVAGAVAKQGVITNKVKSSTVAALTTSVAHNLSVDEFVAIFGVDDTFDGTYVVASTPTATTFTYSLSGSAVAPTAVAATSKFKNAQVKLYSLTPQDVYDGTLAVSPTTSPIVLDTVYRDFIYDYISPREIVGVNSLVMPSVALDLVKVTCNVAVLPSFIQAVVKANVEAAIKLLFNFDNVSFGQTVTLGTLYRSILGVDGVDYVSISRFTTGSADVIDTATLSPTVEGVQATATNLLLLQELSVTASSGVSSV